MKVLLLMVPVSWEVVVQETESKTFIDRIIWKRVERLRKEKSRTTQKEKVVVRNKSMFCIVLMEDQKILNILLKTEPTGMIKRFSL